METDPLPRPKWKRGEIIRHRSSGHPYKVLHLLKDCSTLLEDLEDRGLVRHCFNLDPCNYDEFSRDADMELKKDNSWVYQPVTL